MTQSNYVLITILVCALCTQVTRWLPFLLFGGKKEVPGLVRYLGTILPAAIMAVLVVYCLKGITPLAYPYGLPELYPLPWWWDSTSGREIPLPALRWERCAT